MTEILHGGGTPSYTFQPDATVSGGDNQTKILSATLFGGGTGDDTFTFTSGPLVVTEIARKLGRAKPIGRASETDLARTLTVVQSAAGGPINRVTETDLARTLTVVKNRTLAPGRATETDLAQTLLAPGPSNQSVATNRASETDLARTLTRVLAARVLNLGRVTETDIALGVEGDIPPQNLDLNLIIETDELAALILVAPPQITLTLLTPVLNQAPGVIQVIISGGLPETVVDIEIDGTVVLTVTLDLDGNIGPISVPVDGTLGTAGEHDLTADTAATTFTITLDPAAFPDPPPSDDPPTDVPGSVIAGVRHWAFQDLAVGGIGTWVLPINPDKGVTDSPWPVKQFTSRHSTANSGRWHIFQGQTPPKEWSFGGYFPREEDVEKLLQYRDINRRIYVIDHHNRAWICVLTGVEIVPRLRQTWVGRGEDPLITDWGTDWKVTAMILDPNWVTPA